MLGILKRLEANGRHLLGLINDVLDLSKIEAGQLVLELSDYCIQDIAQTVRSTLEPLAADKKLGFIRQQTSVINAIRAHLAEFGIVAPAGRNGVEHLLSVAADSTPIVHSNAHRASALVHASPGIDGRPTCRQCRF